MLHYQGYLMSTKTKPLYYNWLTLYFIWLKTAEKSSWNLKYQIRMRFKRLHTSWMAEVLPISFLFCFFLLFYHYINIIIIFIIIIAIIIFLIKTLFKSVVDTTESRFEDCYNKEIFVKHIWVIKKRTHIRQSCLKRGTHIDLPKRESKII